MTKTIQKTLAIFREHNGILRTANAQRLGIHPRTLYAMHKAGLLERLERGLYRLTEMPLLANPDLVMVALKVPYGVICLVSALAFHGLTTEVPHAVDIALQKGSLRPRLDYPPVRIFWFSGTAWQEGTETYLIDGISIRITNPAKSVADIFKYRRKLGTEVALEALKLYRQHSEFDVNVLLHYARICRVEKILRPYLETML